MNSINIIMFDSQEQFHVSMFSMGSILGRMNKRLILNIYLSIQTISGALDALFLKDGMVFNKKEN